MSKNITDLSFSRNEELIKTYRYFSSTTKDKEIGDIERNLIVTTKRVVLESTNKFGFSRDEFPIDCIDRIDTIFYRSKKGIIGIFLLFLGIIIAISGIISGEILDYLFAGFNYLLIGIGIILLILGILYMAIKKSKQAFKLTLYSTKQFYNFSSISAENYIVKERKAKKESKKVKIISNVTPVAVVMLNELNALLIDINDFNFQIEYAKQMVLRKNLSPEEFEHHYHYLLNRITTLYK